MGKEEKKRKCFNIEFDLHILYMHEFNLIKTMHETFLLHQTNEDTLFC